MDKIRILMGDECSLRTRDSFQRGLNKITHALDASIEKAKERFFIRAGNATHPLKPSELLDYCKQRWPEGAGAPSELTGAHHGA